MDLFTAIEKSWPYLIVAAPGVWAVGKDLLGRRDAARKAAAEAERLEADLMLKAQEAAGRAVDLLQEQADRLAKRLEQVERELQDLQREHTRMIGDKDAKIALLEGEKRQLQAIIEAYRRQLEAHHVPVPPVPAHFEVAGDPPSVRPAAEGAL